MVKNNNYPMERKNEKKSYQQRERKREILFMIYLFVN